MLVEYFSDIYQYFIILECQSFLYQTFKSILLVLQQKNQCSIYIAIELSCLQSVCQTYTSVLKSQKVSPVLYQTFKTLLLILQQKTSHLYILQQSYSACRVFVRHIPVSYSLRMSVSSISDIYISFTIIATKKPVFYIHILQWSYHICRVFVRHIPVFYNLRMSVISISDF